MISNYAGVLRKYAAFSGRATRTEYWLFILAQIIIQVALGALATIALIAGLTLFASLILAIFILYLLGTLLPGLGLTVRRFHDGGYSGWMILLALIPAIGGIILLIFMVLPSERGGNRHGPDPRGAVA